MTDPISPSAPRPDPAPLGTGSSSGPYADAELAQLWKGVGGFRGRHGLSSDEMDVWEAMQAELQHRAPALLQRLKPRTIDIEQEEARFESAGMHVLRKHGPHLEILASIPGVPSLQGRKEGDAYFGDKRVSQSRDNFKWDSIPLLNALINGHVQRNWRSIANDLALYGGHAVVLEDKQHGLGILGTGLIEERGRWIQTRTDRAYLSLKTVTVPEIGWFIPAAYPKPSRGFLRADLYEP